MALLIFSTALSFVGIVGTAGWAGFNYAKNGLGWELIFCLVAMLVLASALGFNCATWRLVGRVDELKRMVVGQFENELA